MRPLKAIRKHCLWCMKDQDAEVRECTSLKCILHGCRMGKNNSDPHSSALQLIKQYCTGCASDSPKRRINCEFTECNLYQFRNGHNPNIKVLRGAAQINSNQKLVVPDCGLSDQSEENNQGGQL